jgi:hypothetical protein
MTRIVGTVTMKTRITASPTGSSDRPGAKIFQFGNLPQDCGLPLFQIGGMGCFLSTQRITYLTIWRPKKRDLPIPHFHVAYVTQPLPQKLSSIVNRQILSLYGCRSNAIVCPGTSGMP